MSLRPQLEAIIYAAETPISLDQISSLVKDSLLAESPEIDAAEIKSRIRAMLDLSFSTMIVMMVSFMLMGLTGIILPFLVQIWNRGYIWLSIVLIIIVFIYMGVFNESHFKKLRRLVGLPYMIRNKKMPAEPASSPEEVDALLKKANPRLFALVGWGIPAIILWLMVFRPF